MALKKEKSKINPGILKLYEEAISSIPGMERKGATMPYTSFNGHMFSFLSAQGSLGLRLPDGEREKFLEKYKTTLFEAHGTILKEYVTVPETLWRDSKAIKKYFKIAYDYVRSLQPKTVKNK